MSLSFTEKGEAVMKEITKGDEYEDIPYQEIFNRKKYPEVP